MKMRICSVKCVCVCVCVCEDRMRVCVFKFGNACSICKKNTVENVNFDKGRFFIIKIEIKIGLTLIIWKINEIIEKWNTGGEKTGGL